MATYHESDVGVRCFWVETGRPTLAARLMFRFGMADEAITESGWQHLLEHASLDSLGRGGRVDINGNVGLLETGFDFHGDPAGVVEHLGRLVEWLAAPRLDRLDHERGVLRAESDLRGTTPFGRALSWRYGARGPGLASYLEPGLGRATPEALADRAARVFVRDNAVLVLDGPPPEGLSIDLPPGALLPVPVATPVETDPAGYEDVSGIVFSSTVPRDGDMWIGVQVLQRVLTERLRHGAGVVYAPWTHYERVDASTAVVGAGSDIRPDLSRSIVSTVRTILGDLATKGPHQEWVDDTVERMLRGMTDPYAAIGAPVAAAARYLHGRDQSEQEDLIARLEQVTAEDLRVAFADLLDDVLIGASADAFDGSSLPVMRLPHTSPTKGGPRYRSINWPASKAQLRTAGRGVEVSAGSTALEIRYDEVAAVYTYEDGVRCLIREDGYTLTVDPQAWKDGQRAVAEIDRRIPEDARLPHPATPREPLVRAGFLRRWWPALTRGLRSRAILNLAVVLAIVLVGLVLVGLVVVGEGEHAIVPVAVGLSFGVRGLIRRGGRSGG